ncbi:MAG: hypothetical protein IBX36_05210 [Dehalococcoidia bacterium]|nr:hypothetical protein [Dehalococcoidia bacterium]
MTERITFQWYVGQQLASLLPYRKKGLIFGHQVCEWAAVVPMAKAAFSLGCSLSLANKSAAEEILTESVGDATSLEGKHVAIPPPWRTAFSEAIQYLERGREQSHSVDTVTFEDLYPELMSNKFKGILLTPEECVGRVGQWVIPGLVFGVLFPEDALSMLKAWATQPGEWKDLGVGGLRFDPSPLLSSVEEAYKQAQLIYEAWQQSHI